VITVTGENLDKANVSKVYLTDDKNDFVCEVTNQSATEIKLKIPAKATGRLRLGSVRDGFLVRLDGLGPPVLHVVDLAHAQQRLHTGIEVHFFAGGGDLLHVLERLVQVVVPELNRSLLVVDLRPRPPVEAGRVAGFEPRHLFQRLQSADAIAGLA